MDDHFQYSLAHRASPGKHRNPPWFHLSAWRYRWGPIITFPFSECEFYSLPKHQRSNSAFSFQSGKWPQDAKRFAWRYLHERNLYHARKTNPEAVIQFAASLIRYHGIAHTKERAALVQRRCGRQITYRAGLWCGYGFLEELKNGAFTKTAEFEALWSAGQRMREEDIVNEVSGRLRDFSVMGQSAN